MCFFILHSHHHIGRPPRHTHTHLTPHSSLPLANTRRQTPRGERREPANQNCRKQRESDEARARAAAAAAGAGAAVPSGSCAAAIRVRPLGGVAVEREREREREETLSLSLSPKNPLLSLSLFVSSHTRVGDRPEARPHSPCQAVVAHHTPTHTHTVDRSPRFLSPNQKQNKQIHTDGSSAAPSPPPPPPPPRRPPRSCAARPPRSCTPPRTRPSPPSLRTSRWACPPCRPP
jgi:hypothetical protein